MKLETLNIWGGRVYDPLIEHVKKQASEIDIFCFQEVYSTPTDKKYTRDGSFQKRMKITNVSLPRADIHKQLSQILPQFRNYYSPAEERADYLGDVDYELYFGTAIFVTDNIHDINYGESPIFSDEEVKSFGKDAFGLKNMQYIQFEKEGKQITIANLHGFWNGKGKTDSPERIEQSRRIRKLLDSVDGAKILCGDFNLAPDTESLAILEDGMINLVKKYGVTTTRSNYYDKPLKFADYILVSPDVDVIDFQVLPDEVSDHLPLYLEFS